MTSDEDIERMKKRIRELEWEIAQYPDAVVEEAHRQVLQALRKLGQRRCR